MVKSKKPKVESVPGKDAVKVGPEGISKKTLTIDQMIEGMDNELTLVFEHAKTNSKRIFNTLLDALKGAASQISRYGAENEKLRKICKARGIDIEKALKDQPNREQRRAAEKKSRRKTAQS